MSIAVACVGLATADTIVSLPSWPSPDGRLLADAIVRAEGGPAATAAVTLARLGHRAAIVGAVGDDASGERVRAGLERDGVDVSHLRTLPGATGESVVLLDRSAATRTILHAPGARLAELDAGSRATAAAAAWVHVDHAGHRLLGGLDGPRVSVDAGHRIDGLSLDGVDLYAPSEAALLDRYPGRRLPAAMATALSEGAGAVVVTLGARGAMAADGSGAWRVPAPAVDVVSTLGAGDVFHGALLAGLLDGRPLAEAARRATVAAALSCRALDGRGAIPDATELDAAMTDAPGLEPMLLNAER